MGESSGLSASDVLALTRNNNGGGMFGGDGWSGLIGLLAIAGIFGGGFGGFGGFGGGGRGTPATTEDVRSAVDQQTLISKIDQQTYGLTDVFTALNTNLNNNFRGIDNAICNLGYQAQKCCCDNQMAIMNLGAGIDKQFCTLGNLIQSNTRDVIENANCNTRSILDFLVQDKISTLTAENQALKFKASQADQNAFFTANQNAQTAELIRRLGADCPVPAYIVPNPNCCYNYNVAGVGYGNNGCGCNNY